MTGKTFYRCAGILIATKILLQTSMALAETLADIDQEIQANPTLKTDRGGLDAYNIYEGITSNRLHRKVAILVNAGIHPRFYQSADGVRDYTNFYSFTSKVGVTDTKLDLITTDSTFRLYRRGSSSYKEAFGYLGSWWSDRYRGIEDSRDKLAILEAWGSDLQRIYVIDMPAGHTLVGGLAAPMERNGEYRNGGAYQYYYRGASASWLVYALSAPDYLKSYSGAVTSAQQAGRSIATNLAVHLHQTRHAISDDHAAQEGELWLRGFAGDVNYNDDGNVNSQTTGMGIGWQRMINGWSSSESSSYIGLLFGQGINLQQYGKSGVENDSRATVGGLYGLYTKSPELAHSWYGNFSFLFGALDLNNTVPGELEYGLAQEYTGYTTVLTVENGISVHRGNGWSLEPQLQFLYTRIFQDSFNDKLGARISLEQGDSFRGCLGLEIRKNLQKTDNRKLDLWTKLSYIHDFSGRNEVWVAGDLSRSDLDRNIYGVTVGTDLKFDSRWSLQCQFEEFFDGEKGWQGNLSVAYNW